LRHCHLGTLLSSAEGLPFSILEFLRLGVPVLATDVNGIPDVVTDGVGVLMPRSFTLSELCDRLGTIATFGTEYQALAKAACRRRHFASWTRAMADFARVMEIDS
jgi:glycosyltransferase involved in cell wall biosynthesis